MRHWTTERCRVLAALAAAIAIAACSDASSPAVQKSPEGNYTIATVNGKPVPAPLFSDTGGYTLEITSGLLTLTSDGKYSSVMGFRQTLPGAVSTYSDSTGGTWLRTGGNVQFTETSTGFTVAAVWTNGRITVTDSSSADAPVSLVYNLVR
jgi:hypothetical protein